MRTTRVYCFCRARSIGEQQWIFCQKREIGVGDYFAIFFSKHILKGLIWLVLIHSVLLHCQIFPPGQCPSNSSRPDFSLVFALLLLDSAQLNNVFYLWQSVSFILSWAAFPKIEKQNISLRFIISCICLYL